MIWKARNKWVFEQSTKQPSVIAGEAIEFWQEFQSICNSGSSTTQAVTGQCINLTLHWNPPCKPMYKEYFDGAVFEDLHRTGAGVIIRNEQGLLIAAMSRKGRPVMESFVAELVAAVQTIRFARDVGIQRGRVLVGDYI